MLTTGIDAINFYTSSYYLNLQTLAQARGVDPEKFCSDLGQKKMSITPPGEDVVTLAANAAVDVLQYCDINDIAVLLFATESGIDCSKAAGMYVHQLLQLPSSCRVVELKQACYSATAGLQLALPFLRQNPTKKILLIAADIARYALGGAAESSQGSGAVAMLLSVKPRLLVIEKESGIYTKEVMDFWRPHYSDVAIVDGRLSCDVYLRMLSEVWCAYKISSGRDFNDHQYFCYHTPVPKLVERAHRRLAKINGYQHLSDAEFSRQVGQSLWYSRQIGNTYAASLYLGVISLLEDAGDDFDVDIVPIPSGQDLGGKRLGLYSYGSGSVAEYFSAVVVDGYRTMLSPQRHLDALEQRTELTYAEYENFYNFQLPQDGSILEIPQYETGRFRLAKVTQHQRIYEAVFGHHSRL